MARGSGHVAGETSAFRAGITFPRLSGDPAGTTTPEELLAASQATCYAIGLRSVLGQHRASAERVTVTATITADKGGGVIRLVSSHLQAVIEGLAGIENDRLPEIARAAEAACTISNAIRGSVVLSFDVTATPATSPETVHP